MNMLVRNLLFIIALLLVSSFVLVQSSTNGLEIIPRGFMKDYPREAYKLEVKYPEIRDSLQKMHFDINFEVNRIMATSITGFQKKLQAEGGANPDGYSYFFFDYRVKETPARFLSLQFNCKTFYFGAQLPVVRNYAVNYDLQQQQIMDLASLFRPEIDWASQLAQVAARWQASSPGNPASAGAFTITRQGLVLYFNGEAKGGTDRQLVIPWPELAPLLNPEKASDLLKN